MIHRIWGTIKAFFTNGNFSIWLDNHMAYFIVVGLAIIITLTIMILIKINKDIRKMDKEKRKRDKHILRFLSDKKNKTY
jgi:hypothetical protein